jgi:hypothetical protein
MTCPGSMAVYSISSQAKFVRAKSCQPVAITQADDPPPVGSQATSISQSGLTDGCKASHCAKLTLFKRRQSAMTSKAPLQQRFFRHTIPQRTSHIFQFRSPELYLTQTQINVAILPTVQTYTAVIKHFF